MSEERTKTELKREYKVENDKITISSIVEEVVPINKFLEIYAQKLQMLEQQRNQLNGLLAQMNQVQARIPVMDKVMEEDLMKKKEEYTIIRDMDKVEALRSNVQQVQVSVANLDRDVKETRGEVEKLSKGVGSVEEKAPCSGCEDCKIEKDDKHGTQ